MSQESETCFQHTKIQVLPAGYRSVNGLLSIKTKTDSADIKASEVFELSLLFACLLPFGC